jgi:hypothetical protein
MNFNIEPTDKCKFTKAEWNNDLLDSAVCGIGKEINEKVNSMMLFDPEVTSSEFFKTTFVNPKRWGAMVTEQQIQRLLEEGLL